MILKFRILATLLIFLSTGIQCIKPVPAGTENIYRLTADTVFFAVIGDFGYPGDPARKVAAMVERWKPEFIITTGDNSYEDETGIGMDKTIGQYYCNFIYNPDAPIIYKCEGRAKFEKINRFFPVPGNHEFNLNSTAEYRKYFTLPGNELNYEFVWGPAHFFAINSGPDGKIYNENSENASWLKDKLTNSKMPWKIVYFHHPPYSPGHHGNHNSMQWPYKEWGANLVIAGHNHLYARINKRDEENIFYLVNGLGGHPSRYSCNSKQLNPQKFDVICYNADFGAMKISANSKLLQMGFYNITNEELIDTLTLKK